MLDFDAALRHHLDQIPIRQPKADISTHAQLNDVGVKRALAVDRVTVNGLRQWDLCKDRGSYSMALDAPEPHRRSSDGYHLPDGRRR